MFSILRPTILGIRPYWRSFTSISSIHTHWRSKMCTSRRLFGTKLETALRNAKYLTQREIDELAKEIGKKRNRDTMYYIVGFSVFMLGGCWAAIPIYRMFCDDTSYGTAMGRLRKDTDKIDGMAPVKDHSVRIRFNADAGGSMYWKFKPLQEVIYVHPGETALAFFTATNPTDRPIVGVSTYNIIPYDAAAYFNKIQCFCFDEQLLNPGEQVDLPVFFYLDPDFAFDPMVCDLEEVILSYTFFESKSNVMLQRPKTDSLLSGLIGKAGSDVNDKPAIAVSA